MDDWLLDPEIAYLNHGAFGALPVVVADAAAEIRNRIERDPSDALARRLPGMLDEVRGQVAHLLSADPAGCVFVPNATTGTATVLGSMPFSAGDEIVATDHAYPAVDKQLARLAAGDRVVLRRAEVPLFPESVAQVVDAVLAEVRSATRLMVIDAVASPTGMVMPVGAIVAAAHDRGIPVLVDAAHAPGQLPVDLRAEAPDFWVGNLHKWVCSPRAAAVLVVAPRWRETIRPLVASHGYDEGLQAAFDWTGTFDATPILAVPAALAFWESSGGWDAVRRRQHALVSAGAATVANALGGRAVGPGPGFSAAMRVIDLGRAMSYDSGLELSERLLTEHRVEAVVMHFGGTSWIRVCGQVYNSPADYQRLAEALPALLAHLARAGRLGITGRAANRCPGSGPDAREPTEPPAAPRA